MRLNLILKIILTGIMLSGCTTWRADPHTEPAAAGFGTQTAENSLPKPTADLRALGMVTILPRDAVPAIDQPVFLSADEADREYAPYELVIGVEINGEAKAYSAPFLSRHEIVNDSVGGAAIAVTWCPVCFTALVYDRTINDEEFSFGVSGKLMHNGLVMYDRQTDSLWAQVLGEAVSGPMVGTRLEFIPAFQTTWEDWKATHPDTTALEKGYFGDYDPYLNYYEFDYAGVVSPNRVSDRLGQKEFVIGVEHLGDTVAFPFTVMSLEPIVNYYVGDTPILAVFNDQTATGLAYQRGLADGSVLSFKIVEGMTIVDQETGSTWNGITGEAISGPLAGESLIRVKSTLAFWFGWYDFYPDTDVYGVPEE
ncbi:MAG: DUF3179 domain-containing protein [Chloroflexota bacterium]